MVCMGPLDGDLCNKYDSALYVLTYIVQDDSNTNQKIGY